MPRKVSGEHSRQYFISNYLPVLEPINSDHNVQKYCFYVFKLSFSYYVV